jgi:hypothetical protein
MNLKLIKDEVEEIGINPESPFVEAVGIRMTTVKGGTPGTITLQALKHDNSSTTVPISLILQSDEILSAMNRVLSQAHQIAKLTIILESEVVPSIEIELNRDNNFVDVQNPLVSFDTHLKSYDNSRIVFSAPYGYGKSTFLDIYFQAETEKYEVFKVFPVNYSIASNEDIFKYIKCDLLFQLLGKGVEFDYEEVNKFLTTQEYLLMNPRKVLKELIKASAHLNSNVSRVLGKLKGLGDAMEKYHNAQQKDERKEAVDYIEEIYESEGSIYEDNFYTQLIRQLLSQLKESKGKETVLIIEDLDRVDPDHIFRILNVISSHFDTYKNATDPSLEPHNKFGFDKIIIVCDKRNIQRVFEHRYGAGADFTGYFNKFYSKTPYEFQNEEALAFHIGMVEKIPDEASIVEWLGPYFTATKKVLHDLIMSNKLTLRELIKFSKVNIYRDVILKLDRLNKEELYKKSLFFVLYEYLKYIDGVENKLAEMKNLESTYKRINLNHFVKLGFVPLSTRDPEHPVFRYEYKKTKWKFSLQDYNTPYYDCTEIEFEGGIEVKKYGNTDFYEIFLLNIQKYKEVGGLLIK